MPGPDQPFEAKALLAAIIDSSDDAIYSKDSDARITSWNRAAERLYGYTEKEALGQDISMIIPEDRRGEERVILGRILQGEKIEHYETKRKAKDGSIVEMWLSVSPVHSRSGEIVGASVVGRDISDRRRQEALEQEIQKRDFIARAAHELKTPLTAISGMAQILRDKSALLSEDEREQAFTSLMRQSERANRLISDLLELARLESGQVEVELATVDLHEVVVGSIEAAEDVDDFAVEARVEPGTVVVADPFRLEEVFVNLFSNSAKYGATSAVVTVHRENDVVRVVVADDGPGVPEDLVPKVFEPFTRASQTKVPGSGLGLSIAKRLCHAFGGDIEYQQNQPSGAVFVIKLPSA